MSKNSILIRPAEQKDAEDINRLRRMPGVAENLMALPSETIGNNERFLGNRSDDDHLFCAELSDGAYTKVVGLAGLHVKKIARQRHCAVLGILVDKACHNQGVGTKLMATLMDLADNWLLLKRVELTVFPENTAAIKLYEKFGFVREGTLKYAGVRHGKYTDFLLMARYHASLTDKD